MDSAWSQSPRPHADWTPVRPHKVSYNVSYNKREIRERTISTALSGRAEEGQRLCINGVSMTLS